MRLTILGCSGSVPGPGTNASGYLLEADGFLLALDLGNGTVSALQQLRDPFALDALLLSHLHPDHCADFGALTVIRRYHPERLAAGRPQRLPVYGPEGNEQRLINLYAPDERERAETDLSDVYTFAPLPTEPAMIGPFEVRAVEVAHPTPAYGVRIRHGGTTFAYTGDTGMCPALDELAAGADVLLAEATWTHADDRPPGIHLSGVEVGRLAQRAGVGRVLITHIAPWTDPARIHAEVKSEFPGPSDIVVQGASYDLRPHG